MPISAILLSVLALAPFIGCGLGALDSHAATADHMLTGLIGWGALVLAFIGGLHWGLAMRDPDPAVRPATWERKRNVLIGLAALLPVLGWVALMLPVAAPSWLALLLVIAGYIATLVVEHQAGARAVLPSGYLTVRWAFTVVAVAMLTTVLTLRLLGKTIVF